MNNLKNPIFFRLTKVDTVKRTVEGVATAETPDKTGEVCHYETTKPFYEKWSAGIAKATNGKSLGNVRAMHSNIAAGKVVDLQFDDAQKAIRITAKIVDDAEWNKVVEGVYTGFSQGGEYVEKWKENDLTYYTADPSEVSIVDNPCLAEATFEVIKADGVAEMRKFFVKPPAAAEPEVKQGWVAKDGEFFKTKAEAMKHNTLLDARAAVAKTTEGVQALLNTIEDDLDKREFSDDERQKAADAGEAMPDGSFPIKSEQDLKNAIRAVGRASDPAKAKEHIITRAKAMNLTDVLPTDWEGSTQKKTDGEKSSGAKMKKDMNTVARAACLIQELEWLCQCVEMEEAWEEDETSMAPDHLEEIVKELCSFLTMYVEEECAEMVEDHGGTGIEVPMEMSAVHADGLSRQIAGIIKLGGKDVTDESAFNKFRIALKEFIEKAKAKSGEMPADMADHVTAIHKAASHIMKGCMKCMGKAGEMDDAIKSMHKKAGDICDRCMKMGSSFKPDDSDDDAGDDGDATKLMKALAEKDALQKSLDSLTAQLGEISKRLKTVEDQPAPRKGKLMIVEKGHERETPEQDRADETRPSTLPNGISPEESRSRFSSK